MKKIIISLLFGSSCLMAATKDFSDMPDELMDYALCAHSFAKGHPAEIEDVYLGLKNGMKDNTLSYGSEYSLKGCLSDELQNGPSRSQACTISFDLLEAKGAPGQVVWALYSPGMAFHKGLRIVTGKRKSLVLECNEFTHTTLEGRQSRRTLGKIADLLGKTITVVYDGAKDTVQAYVNGEPVGRVMNLSRRNTDKANRLISRMAWGDNYCGYGQIERVTIDNVYFWGEALESEQIRQLLKFEMTPLYWGIAGGAAGLLLIIAALIIVRLKKKARPAA